MSDPDYNYLRGITGLRAEIRRLTGGNLSDQKQIQDHVAHLRRRIEALKIAYSTFDGPIADDPIDFADAPVATVDDDTLVAETGVTPPPSADPGNGMMPADERLPDYCLRPEDDPDWGDPTK